MQSLDYKLKALINYILKLMGSNYYLMTSRVFVLIFFVLVSITTTTTTPAAAMFQDVEITAGKPNIRNGGNVVDLVLDRYSASGFKSKQEYLFARLDLQIKLPAGNSAGTVTTFYMSSAWSDSHDEIDLEFLGNETGKPITLHTNIYAQGKGNKEMQFHLWFDPTAAYHTYSILWNQKYIIFYVDRRPIRVFPNQQARGVPFPTSQAMRVYGSIWNADDWATQGGRVKTDWANAPFIASYTNFKTTPCPASSTSVLCGPTWSGVKHTSSNGQVLAQAAVPVVDGWTRRMTRLMQSKFMIYDYCSDSKRFPQGLPVECKTRM